MRRKLSIYMEANWSYLKFGSKFSDLCAVTLFTYMSINCICQLFLFHFMTKLTKIRFMFEWQTLNHVTLSHYSWPPFAHKVLKLNTVWQWSWEIWILDMWCHILSCIGVWYAVDAYVIVVTNCMLLYLNAF